MSFGNSLINYSKNIKSTSTHIQILFLILRIDFWKSLSNSPIKVEDITWHTGSRPKIGPILTKPKFRCHALTNHQIHLTLGSKRMLVCQNQTCCQGGLKKGDKVWDSGPNFKNPCTDFWFMIQISSFGIWPMVYFPPFQLHILILQWFNHFNWLFCSW